MTAAMIVGAIVVTLTIRWPFETAMGAALFAAGATLLFEMTVLGWQP